MDPDPAIFVIDLQDTNKKLIKKKFFCLLLFEGTFTSVEIKLFLLLLLDPDPDLLVRGIDPEAKNIWIRRIRICNTVFNVTEQNYHLTADLFCYR
jgi:hypothetical protein